MPLSILLTISSNRCENADLTSPRVGPKQSYVSCPTGTSYLKNLHLYSKHLPQFMGSNVETLLYKLDEVFPCIYSHLFLSLLLKCLEMGDIYRPERDHSICAQRFTFWNRVINSLKQFYCFVLEPSAEQNLVKINIT